MNLKANIKVSIIVPVYNVESFLPQCLDCLSMQTYSNYEVILVDDGSLDASGKICDEYAHKHENTKVIHQLNKGLSGARNSGVLVATGSYVTFVDADDLITPYYVEILVSILVETGADVAVGRTIKFWNTISIPGNNHMSDVRCNDTEVFSTNKALREMCYGKKFGVSACSKLYPRALVEKYPYPLGKMHEDLDTTYRILGDVQNVAFSNQYIYFYRQRENSIMHQKFNIAHLYALEAAQGELDYMVRLYPDCVTAARFRYVLEATALIPMLLNPTKENRKFFKYIRKKILPLCRGVICDDEASLVTKVRCVSTALGYTFSNIIFRILGKLKQRNADSIRASLV